MAARFLAAALLLAAQDLKVGEPAPDFTLKTLDGRREVTLSKLQKIAALIVAKPGSEELKAGASALDEVAKKCKDKAAFFLIYLGAVQKHDLKMSIDVLVDGAAPWTEGLYVVDASGKLVWKSAKLKADSWKKEILAAATGSRKGDGSQPKEVKAAPMPATSRGSGGPTSSGKQRLSNGTEIEMIVPGANSGAVPVLIVFSGVEGKETMAQNLRQIGMAGHVIAVLDGRTAKASDGVETLAQLRRWYNVDNDAVKVLTESAGTHEGLTFALQTAQKDIAAVWANDPVAVVTPGDNAAAFGSAGAGAKAPNDVERAKAIVEGMKQKGYHTQEPFVDPNSGHGTSQGLMQGLKFLSDKRRR